MTSCPNNVWNHTSGCACTPGAVTAEARDVVLTSAPSIHDVFDDWRDAEEATEFEFDWNYMDFDDYNGWMAYDPEAPRLTRTYAKSVQVGDTVHLPHTTSVYRRATKVSTYVGGEREGLVDIWTEGQDIQTDAPAVSAPEGDLVSTKTFRPTPDLSDPAQFNRELSRRVYEETASLASKADERHDVVRIANDVAETITPDVVREALAQRESR